MGIDRGNKPGRECVGESVLLAFFFFFGLKYSVLAT